MAICIIRNSNACSVGSSRQGTAARADVRDKSYLASIQSVFTNQLGQIYNIKQQASSRTTVEIGKVRRDEVEAKLVVYMCLEKEILSAVPWAVKALSGQDSSPCCACRPSSSPGRTGRSCARVVPGRGRLYMTEQAPPDMIIPPHRPTS